MDFIGLTKVLAQHDILIDGAEAQGLICGMLCGGMSTDDKQWRSVFADLVNNGVAMPESVIEGLNQTFTQLVSQLTSHDFALQLFIPNEDEPLSAQGLGLINWVNGFNAGFGLHQTNLKKCSEDVQEGIEDLAQIARMEPPQDEEDIEAELTEIIEYVRITAMLCFNELHPESEEKPTLH